MEKFARLFRKFYKLWGLFISWCLSKYYARHYKKLTKNLGIPNKKTQGEKEWIAKWSQLQRNPNPIYYRLFSKYIGENPNIVPEDICHNVIEQILNPQPTRPYYADKNMFDKIFPQGILPDTLFRRIDSYYYDANYNPAKLDENLINELKKYDSIFIKPSANTNSGRNIISFKKDENGILCDLQDNAELSLDILKEYAHDHSDFIIQKSIKQHPYIAQFNPSSVNTFRIATYRSVKTNETEVVGIIMRIGKKGSYVDNVHAGGLYVGINLDGTLGKYACEHFGNKYNTFNDIDFANNDYKIPDFEKVINFAKKVGNSAIHHRLLAQDIVLTEDGTPKLIEINLKAFSILPYQFTLAPTFRDYTDEIIEYCKERKNQIERVRVNVF